MGAEPIVIPSEQLSDCAAKATVHSRRQSYFREESSGQTLRGKTAVLDLLTGYLAVRSRALPAFNGAPDYFEQSAFVEGYALQAGIQYSLDHLAKEQVAPCKVLFDTAPNIAVHEYEEQTRAHIILDSLLKEYSSAISEVREANRLGATLSYFSWLSSDVLNQQRALASWSTLENLAQSVELRINGTTIRGYDPTAVRQRIERFYPTKQRISERTVSRPPVSSRAQLNSNVTFDQIAGNHEAKRQLMDGIDILLDYDPVARTNPFSEFVETASTMLIDGPPGSGKTSLLRAATNYGNRKAAAMKKQFETVVLSGTSFKSEYFSRSAQQLKDIIDGVQSGDRAYLVAIEDFDTIFFSRDQTRTSPENDSILEVMLSRLEGLESSNFGNYLLVATTNHPLQGDGALLRRLRETAVYTPGPQTPEEYLQVLFQSVGKGANKYLSLTRKEARELGELCERYGFSGGDVKNIGRRIARDISSRIRMALNQTRWASLSLSEKRRLISSKNVTITYSGSDSSRGLLHYIVNEHQQLQRQREQETERSVTQRLQEALIEHEVNRRLRAVQ